MDLPYTINDILKDPASESAKRLYLQKRLRTLQNECPDEVEFTPPPHRRYTFNEQIRTLLKHELEERAKPPKEGWLITWEIQRITHLSRQELDTYLQEQAILQPTEAEYRTREDGRCHLHYSPKIIVKIQAISAHTASQIKKVTKTTTQPSTVPIDPLTAFALFKPH